MLSIRPFQIVLLGIFASLAIIGVIFFTLFKGSSSEDVQSYGASVTIWGTLPASAFNSVFAEISRDDKEFQVVRYVQKDARTFDLEILNAIAEGRSPDLIVLRSDSIVTHREKLLPISYSTLPERDFKDAYIDGAGIFLFSDGVYGVPFAVDPLVMYWNRDMFSGNGLAVPPATWDALLTTVVPTLTKVAPNFSISRSAVAFGEYANVRNAKAILSLLFLQSGTSIVTESNRQYSITLNQGSQGALPPGDAALSFYTGFALPSAAQYSWSRSLPEDRLQFTSGSLGLYFGFGSEYDAILNSNPNLNFDVAEVPQDASATVKRGLGTFYAFAIPRASGNTAGAFAAVQTLTSARVSASLAGALNLAPVQRSTIAAGTTDPVERVRFSAALIARSWLDPSPIGSENVFKIMIEDVTSGRSRVTQAVSDAVGRLVLLFK